MAAILIVDDESGIRRCIKRIARHLDRRTDGQHAWYYASSCQEALEIAGEVPIDIICSDINMPEQDGFAVLDEMTKLFGNRVAKVILSAFPHKFNLQRAIQAGAWYFLEKPVGADKIVDTFAECLVRLEEQSSEDNTLGSRDQPLDPVGAVLHLGNQLGTQERKKAAYNLIKGLTKKEKSYFLKECKTLVEMEDKEGWIDSTKSGERRYYRLRYKDKDGNVHSEHIGPYDPRELEIKVTANI